ncbi:serine/threonine-protein kinase Nek8 [Tetranychus urticae]|uniref:non-specific serine/threonine protein kinase n=1 Tax=Tetranychus urticae TaxID=32264 RepID=T1L0M4_TETUR|nr:serine/threonine-protein kinase Nek8 [Tetranychus urticae]
MVDFKSFSFNSKALKNIQNDFNYRAADLSTRHLFWENYEKVRVVGKGAFGTAILYRRRLDGDLVVMKEVDVTYMNASERLMAINEVKVLSILDHPNIVSFYNNYEWEGKLLIEMEYCEGGTLAEFLSLLSKPLKEFEILTIFNQIVSGITYIHDRNILHRDLKTANIFMTKEKIFKIGDFGISKILGTHREGASTVVGTPHYISPEMCEGKSYDKKTDIWALGCILYEMACLHKTFEGTNLSALVNKIIKGKYDPVKRIYSARFQKLIGEMLQRDPTLRPHAHEIQNDVSELLIKARLNRYESEIYSNEISTGAMLAADQLYRSIKVWRSLIFEVNLREPNLALNKFDLPFSERVTQFARSSNHFLSLTDNSSIYVWGYGGKGQLGLGRLSKPTNSTGPNPADWVPKAVLVDELSGKFVTKLVAGEGFSIFICKNGLVMSCGSAESCCLGYETEENSYTPKIINELLGYNVQDITSGPRHVMIVTDEGKAMAWGRNIDGQLGIAEESVTVKTPTPVNFAANIVIKRVFTGPDATMFIDDRDVVWACGSNEYNKLGIQEKSLIKKMNFSRIFAPKVVKCIKDKVESISLSHKNTLILLQNGSLLVLGLNETGRISKGSNIVAEKINLLPKMSQNSITKIQAGNDFLLAQTFENQVYFWGIREVEEESKSLLQNQEETSEISEVIKIGETNAPLMNIVEKIGPDYPILLVRDPKVVIEQSKHLTLISSNRNSIRRDYILKPQPILTLYASHVYLRFGEAVSLSSIHCFPDDRVYIIIDTTIPSPNANKNNEPKRQRSRAIGTSVLPVLKEEMSLSMVNTRNLSSTDGIPEWIKLEAERWEKESDASKRIEASRTFPLSARDLEYRNIFQFYQEQIENLNNQLLECQQKNNAYQNQVSELEEQLAKLRREQRKAAANFCNII